MASNAFDPEQPSSQLRRRPRNRKAVHQEEIPQVTAESYNFVVAFVNAENGQEVYAAPALSAGDVERIARKKFPRWSDTHDAPQDAPRRRLSPHLLKDLGHRIEIWIDPWIAAHLRL